MHRSPRRGQATIGYALVIGIALIGTVTVVALGATALTDIQDSSGAGAAEQAMTQFDSRTAQVALGDSRDQTVSVGQTDGSYSVDPDTGYVRIVHLDHDGNATGGDDDNVVDSTSNGNTDNDEELYASTLGTVYYEGSDTEIAYQAGGVWQQTESGSTMVSPPEFHYRGSTLTFPIVRVNNETALPAGTDGVQSGSGRIDLRVSQGGDSRDVYPTQQNGYPDTNASDGVDDGFNATGNGNPYGENGNTDDGDGDGGYYENPATNGTIVVYVESEYYQAWADYFRTRTDGEVDTSDTPGGFVDGSTDPQGDGDDEGVVAVSLSSTGFSGPFPMPGDGSSIFLQGINDHSLSDFGITLYPDDNDEASFKNLKWSMYVQDGGEQFEFNVRHSGQRADNGAPCDIRNYRATVFYSPPDDTDYHIWTNETAFNSTCADLDDDGVKDEVKLEVEFIDDDDGDGVVHDNETTDPRLFYEDHPSSVQHFGTNNRDLNETVTFDQHAGGVPWESSTRTYDADLDNSSNTRPSAETIDRLTNHYFSELGPGFDLTVDDKSSNTVTESRSSGRIFYTGADSFVTYMHITENDVVVRID